jgi:hypothetical protein
VDLASDGPINQGQCSRQEQQETGTGAAGGSSKKQEQEQQAGAAIIRRIIGQLSLDISHLSFRKNQRFKTSAS